MTMSEKEWDKVSFEKREEMFDKEVERNKFEPGECGMCEREDDILVLHPVFLFVVCGSCFASGGK